jgi:DNA-binding IclR family transcriptional regulator
MPQQPRTEGADTARRALRILEVVGRATSPLSLDEIMRGTGLGKSMTYRLVRALQEESYVDRADGGGYVGGSQLFALASASLPNFDSYTAYLPLLREIAERAGETCTLHRRVRDRTVLLLGAETVHPLRWVFPVGELTPLTRGGAGIAILSAMSDAEVDDAVVALSEPAAEQVRSEVARARDRGFATSLGANHPGLHGVAAPVPGQPMAISVSGPAERWTENNMIDFAPQLLSLIEQFHRPA